MASRAQENALRHTNIAPDRDGFEVQDPDVFAYPGAISDAELPRPVNTHAMADQNVIPDRRSEPTQDGDAQRDRAPPAHHDQPRDEHPGNLPECTATAVVSTSRKIGQIPALTSRIREVRRFFAG